MNNDIPEICMAVCAIMMIASMIFSAVAYDTAKVATIKADANRVRYQKVMKRFYCDYTLKKDN